MRKREAEDKEYKGDGEKTGTRRECGVRGTATTVGGAREYRSREKGVVRRDDGQRCQTSQQERIQTVSCACRLDRCDVRIIAGNSVTYRP